MARILARVRRLPADLVQASRCAYFHALSDCRNLEGHPRLVQPVLFSGEGTIRFGRDVTLGVRPSPFLYTGYGHFEARLPESRIQLGDDVWINNNACLISAGAGISIGSGCRIGHNFVCFDTDFHELPLGCGGSVRVGSVVIEDHVFIGSNVTVTRNVRIGTHAAIGAGSVVTGDVPPFSLASGNPAVIRRHLPDGTTDSRGSA